VTLATLLTPGPPQYSNTWFTVYGRTSFRFGAFACQPLQVALSRYPGVIVGNSPFSGGSGARIRGSGSYGDVGVYNATTRMDSGSYEGLVRSKRDTGSELDNDKFRDSYRDMRPGSSYESETSSSSGSGSKYGGAAGNIDAGSYEVVIGAAANTKTMLRRTIGGNEVATVDTPEILECTKPK
jgi:hypothetical protein